MSTNRLISGVKPTGNIHIGNYFGAIKQLLDLQDKFEGLVFIADLHALNQVQNASALSQMTKDVALAYLAVGLDPNKLTLFRQSQVPEHSELCVILNSITSLGMLERAHAYKDAVAKGKSINVGLFDYPVLMAADILLYKASIVPVGNDQQQHLEMTVDIAERFNHLYGNVFPIPRAYILETTGIVPGLDGRKMSKSYGNVLGLFDSQEEMKKKIMSIKTDSKRPEDPKDPDTCTIYNLYKLFSTEPETAELREMYLKGGMGYKEAKDRLLFVADRFLSPIREQKIKIEQQKGYLEDVLEQGRGNASKIAYLNMQEIKQKIGL